MKKLAPCPFCQCYPDEHPVVSTGGTDQWVIRCEAMECFVNPSLVADTKSDAREQWAMRKSKPRPLNQP